MLVVKGYCLNYRIKFLFIQNKYISTPAKCASAFGDTSLKYNDPKPLDTYTSVQDYYAGKSIFLTGGTGFLGKVLLEKLLYTCTKLDKVYVLVREKNGEPIHHRLENDIFKNPLFEKLKEHFPDSLKKVVPIAGDVTKPNLAIKSEDIKTLVEKVSVVFHAAASVKFNEPLGVILKSNLEGPAEMLKLCQRMNNLKALIHVSTAYSVTKDVGDNVIEEKVYPAPAEIERVHNFIKKYNNDKKKTKEFLGGLANTYTYTKALAETYVAENHGNIPTCIVRPSIVGPKIDEPRIGWLDNWFGITGLLYNVSTGLNRVSLGNGNNVVDVIPVDYVINTCIVAAAKHDGSKNIRVYNSCSSEANPLLWREIHKMFKEDTVKHGWNDFPFPFTFFIESRISTAMLTFVLQVVPAYIADFYLILTGKTPRYVKTQDRVLRVRQSIKFFTVNTWVIKSGNVRSLYSSLSEHDRRLFPCDPAHIDWKKYIPIYSQGVNKYLTHNK